MNNHCNKAMSHVKMKCSQYKGEGHSAWLNFGHCLEVGCSLAAKQLFHIFKCIHVLKNYQTF